MATKPATKQLNSKQKEILARKLGYDGPMNMFEEFIKSDPAMSAKYSTVVEKYMARGGMARRYATGGIVSSGDANQELRDIAAFFGYEGPAFGNPTILKNAYKEYTKAQEKLKTATADVWIKNYNNTLARAKQKAIDEFNKGKTKVDALNAKKGAEYAEAYNELQELLKNPVAQSDAKTRARIAGLQAKVKNTLSSWERSAKSYGASFSMEGFDPSIATKEPEIVKTVPTAPVIPAPPPKAEPLKATPVTTTPAAMTTQQQEMVQKAQETNAAVKEEIKSTLPGYTPPPAVTTPPPTAVTADQLTGTGAETTTQAPAATTTTQESTTTTPAPATPQVVQMAAPEKPEVPVIEAQKIQESADQFVTGEAAPATATTITAQQADPAATVTAPDPREAATVDASTSMDTVKTALEDVKPVTGTVSDEAQVTAQTMEPTETAVSELEAAQGEATLVEAPAPRTVQEGELVSGPAVDQARVEEALAQNVAAEGEVTPEMTVQYQIQQLTEGFDATNPPPWAAGAIRNVNSVLAQRGIGASSLAGQALIQAALESALPIAAADAATFKEMGIQNLSNRQQMAVLTAQQRAAFLGQEFDQEFQTRVTNAATISEIANINFTAEQQIALENARLVNTVNLANLNNKNALILAEAAQIANLETANLNNRQQAAVVNAQSFLQMDLANLANEQQTELFKAQSMINSILSDTAAENAAKQFNASSINQVNQFYDGLTAQINQFNASQTNAMEQFNVSQSNAVAEFNANAQNARDQFNAEYRRIIDQSNAEWRRNIAVADTAAINRANEINAANALGITTIDYSNQWQATRDSMEMAWKTSESALDREVQLALGVLSKQAAIESAKYAVEAEKAKALGSLAAVGLDKLLGAGGGAAALVGALAGSRVGTVGTGGAVGTNGVTGPSFMDFVNSTGTWGLKESVDGVDTYFNGTDTLMIDNMDEKYYWNGSLIWEPNMPDYSAGPYAGAGEIYPDGTYSGVE